MSWIRRETEKGAVQYICPHCHDYHEFREDFGGRTFSENYIFCRRCGARNGTGNAPTLTPPNEWVSVEERLPENHAQVLMWSAKWNIEEAGSYYKGRFWVYSEIGDAYIADDITHWTLLPAPPDSRPPEGEDT